jgi:hypothetical protein
MATLSGDVRSLLFDVMYGGATIVLKRKLLRLLGWVNDKPGAWSTLLDHWVEIGGDRNGLYALEVQDKIILTIKPVGKLVPVSDWADGF